MGIIPYIEPHKRILIMYEKGDKNAQKWTSSLTRSYVQLFFREWTWDISQESGPVSQFRK